MVFFFKFAVIIVGLCAKSEARLRNQVEMVNVFFVVVFFLKERESLSCYDCLSIEMS